MIDSYSITIVLRMNAMGNTQILKSIMIMLNEWINRRVKAKNS
jgi:predicted ATP-binding protein involved in virulence